MMLLLVVPLAAYSKGRPTDNGGGGNNDNPTVTADHVDFGDIFGDLIHIYRDQETGQPIYAQRWVEMPAELPGYGWAYCPIVYTDLVLDDNGYPTRIPFAPYSCDLDALSLALTLNGDEEQAKLIAAEMIVEVDYFGRLNAARTRENNLRMHFDEVISNINQAVALKLGPVGRLMLQFCVVKDLDGVCESYEWSTIDSPMESLGLYTRLMRYGHLATDPLEEDLFWHGDPALYNEDDPATPKVNEDDPSTYPTHPALTKDDFQKFIDAGLEHLLPAGNCWDDDEFLCAAPEALEAEDFDSSAIFLGAAASKTGWVTVDLTQYLNRFLRISLTTDDPNGEEFPPSAYEPVNSLPALYEDCWSSTEDPDYTGEDVEESEEPPPVDDLVYDDVCLICNADGVGDNDDPLCPDAKAVNYELFYNIQERFMDFANAAYSRGTRPDVDDTLIMPFDGISVTGSLEDGLEANTLEYLEGAFSAPQTVNLLEWLEIPNPLGDGYGVNIANFVFAANDAARSIEFIHNYAIPDDLYCKYLPNDHVLFNLSNFQCPTAD